MMEACLCCYVVSLDVAFSGIYMLGLVRLGMVDAGLFLAPYCSIAIAAPAAGSSSRPWLRGGLLPARARPGY
jgi:hypothetical protein